MLSRALLDVAKAPTVSARLGLGSCTLDVDRGSLTDAQVLAAEDLVNDVIRTDVPVRAFFPTPEELGKLDLRRAPKVDSGVRIVDVEGFDITPCGGTHCTRTGQIGVLRIAGTERYKGKTRVSFHAAKRALADARAKERALLELARMFSCGALDVGMAAEKLRAELKDRTDALARARGELTTHVADGLLAAHAPDPSGTTVLFLERDDDLATLRTLAGRLTARPDVVAICATPDAASGDWLVVAQRGAAASFDCGAWLKAKAQAHGGRGGGRPERAEGRLPRGTPVP
jgi:alanyl-tRNA synthetase